MTPDVSVESCVTVPFGFGLRPHTLQHPTPTPARLPFKLTLFFMLPPLGETNLPIELLKIAVGKRSVFIA